MSKVPSPPSGLTESEPFPPDCARRFAFKRRIGAGGFGAVFLAEDRNLGQDVAVKLLFADLLKDIAQVRRFTDEARITAALSHPHVVRVLDFGAEFGVPWIAFELIRGRNVRAMLDASPSGVALVDALAIGIHVARALEAAHAQGILHRDVKPDNVLEAGPGHFKITDFGIAWASGREVKTATGTILGTPRYIAPELVRGQPPAASADVYALGVMLFELLTGQAPFAHEMVGRLLEMHLRDPVPQVTNLRPGLPAELDVVVANALAKEPRDRYAGAGQLAEALEAVRARIESTPEPERVPDLRLVSGARPRPGREGSATRMSRPSGHGATRPVSRAGGGAAAVAAPARGHGRVAWALGALVVALAAWVGARPPHRPEPSPTTSAPPVVASAWPPLAGNFEVDGALYVLLARAVKLSARPPDIRDAAGLSAGCQRWVGEVGAVLDKANGLVAPLVENRGADPTLLLLARPLLELGEQANLAVRTVAIADLSGDTPAVHPVAGALAAWQKTLSAQGKGDYVFPLRCALGPLLNVTARTRWGHSQFYASVDLAKAAVEADEAVVQIARRHGRESSLFELLGRLVFLERVVKGYVAHSPARVRDGLDRVFALIPALEAAEGALAGPDRLLYRQWSGSVTCASLLVLQARAAGAVALDPAVPDAARRRASAIAVDRLSGHGLKPELPWVGAGDPAYLELVGRLVGLVAKLNVPPAVQEELVTAAGRCRLSADVRTAGDLPEGTAAERAAKASALLDCARRLDTHAAASPWARATAAGLRQAAARLGAGPR